MVKFFVLLIKLDENLELSMTNMTFFYPVSENTYHGLN
jgi:hypothetical protein